MTILSFDTSRPSVSLELGEEVVEEPLVEVVPAEVGVARGGDHLDDPVADREDRDVEGPAAEVVDGDRLRPYACRGRRPGPRPWAR